MDAGTLHLVDMAQPYTTSTTDVAGAGLCIPHDLIGYDPSRDPHYVSVKLSTPRGRLLCSAFEALETALVGDDRHEASDLAKLFVGVVQRLMLGREEDNELRSAEATTELALRNHIEAHLADKTLDADRLCDQFGLSRASLYRRFRHDGGVDRYIVGRRLDRCFAELCGASPTRGLVNAVASRWGFTDPGNFNRRFRERFGLAPSECLALLHMTPPAASEDGRKRFLVHEWLRRHRRPSSFNAVVDAVTDAGGASG